MAGGPHQALEACRAWLGFGLRLVGKRGGLDTAWGSRPAPLGQGPGFLPSHRAAPPTPARTGGPLLMAGPSSRGACPATHRPCPHG